MALVLELIILCSPFPNLVAHIAPDFDYPLPDEFWLPRRGRLVR